MALTSRICSKASNGEGHSCFLYRRTNTDPDSTESSYESDDGEGSADEMEDVIVDQLLNPSTPVYAGNILPIPSSNDATPAPVAPVHVAPVTPVALEGDHQQQYPSTDELDSPPSLMTQHSNRRSISSIDLLHDMPWSALPLNPSIVDHEKDKMAQCISIFNRFVARTGPFALNISYATYLETKQRFESYHCRYIQQRMSVHDEEDVLCIFDPVIPDVIDNLDSTSNRFNVHHIFSSEN